jgi:L-ascorbate metabolism protein UlaG (beta-lactamase superfamily)
MVMAPHLTSWAQQRDACGVPLEIAWLGHATALIEVDGARLLTDPLLRRRVGPLVRSAALPGDLGELDAVLLSHLHADHADLPSLRRVARSVPVVAPVGAGAWLRRRGVADVRELRPGQELELGPLSVAAVPATHDARRHALGPAADPIGFVVHGSGSVYFAGDTDLFEEMAGLGGGVDVALLPVWGWGPNLGPGHLDPEGAARAAALVSPRVAIPIHWGTYSLPRPLGNAAQSERQARRFVELAAREAPDVEVRLLRPGQRTRVA